MKASIKNRSIRYVPMLPFAFNKTRDTRSFHTFQEKQNGLFPIEYWEKAALFWSTFTVYAGSVFKPVPASDILNLPTVTCNESTIH